ncbi:MAG: hypothetical protein AAGE05_14700, partial [Pseudomonadota bacterium]
MGADRIRPALGFGEGWYRMVAIVTGNGLGLENTSAFVLGSAGQLGQPGIGRTGHGAYVNAATGNLVLQNRDEILSARHGDIAIARTYNSQGLLTDDNGDNWLPGMTRHLVGTTATPGGTGSTITRVDWDGSETVFTRDASRDYTAANGDVHSVYVSGAGGGAYDTVEHVERATSGYFWRWVDGDTQASDSYTSSTNWSVTNHYDASGTRIDFTYNANGLLETVSAYDSATLQNDTATYFYDGNDNITRIDTVVRDLSTSDPSDTITQTRVYYEYDGSNRLIAVKVDVDLDGSVADTDNDGDGSVDLNGVYVTQYEYDGTSRRISAVTQSDGSRTEFDYSQIGGSYRVTELRELANANGPGTTDDDYRVTTFEYDTVARTTLITSPLGEGVTDPVEKARFQTKLFYNANGELYRIEEPRPDPGEPLRVTRFYYSADGDLEQTITPNGLYTYYTHDANGNVIKEYQNNRGTIVTRIYDDDNNLINETLYRLRYTDVGAPSTIDDVDELTTRFAYDADHNMRFSISAEGLVTEYVYDANGLEQRRFVYNRTAYDFAANGITQLDHTVSLQDMESWAAAITDHSEINATDTTYDYRGNVTRLTSYGLKTDGTPDVAGGRTRIHYVYDQQGLLLSRNYDGEIASETFVYDGLGRLISSNDFNGDTTLYDFQTSYTLSSQSNGLDVYTYYNDKGEVVRTAVRKDAGTAGQSIGAPDTYYHYDPAGRLRMEEDAEDGLTHYFHDDAGRRIATVSPEGRVSEFRYDDDNRLIATIYYATAIGTTGLGTSGNPADIAFSTIRPTAHADDRWEWMLYDYHGNLWRTIDSDGATVVYSYNAAQELTGMSEYAERYAAQYIADFKTTLPEYSNINTLVPLADRPSTNVDNRITHYYYDQDGRLVGVRDPEAYVTQTVYDAAGREIETIRYADQSAVAGNSPFGDILAGLTTGADDIHDYYVYDGRNLLRATIDGEGNLTRYDYSPTGHLTKEIRGQVLSASQLTAFAASDRMLADLPAAGSETLDETVYERSLYGDVTKETRTVAGGTEETIFAYGANRQLISVTTANGTADARESVRRYDVLGRLIGEMSGKGVDLLDGLTEANDHAAIDTIYFEHGTSYYYDELDRVTQVYTAHGTSGTANRTNYHYDDDGNLRFAINRQGDVVEYRYDAKGQQTDAIAYADRLSAGSLPFANTAAAVTAVAAIADSATDSRRQTAYTARGTIASTTDAEGAVTSFDYNPFREVISRTATLNASTALTTTMVYDYDHRGLVTSETRDHGGLGLQTQFSYDAFGRQIQTIDPNGVTRTTGYDRAGRIVETIDGAGETTAFEYDGRGNLVSLTDRLNNETTYSYDAFNRSVTVTTPWGVVTVTEANAHGETVRITDGEGRITAFDYDVDGNLTKTILDPDGTPITVTENVYDRTGKLIETIDGRGTKTSFAYDRADRVIEQIVDPGAGKLNLTTSYAFNGKGETVTTTDPEGRVTETSYDREGRMVEQIVDPAGEAITTRWAYDEGGRLLTLTEADGGTGTRVTEYHYDDAGRRTKTIVDPAGAALETVYTYDANGNVVARTDPAGHVSRFVYDEENRQIYAVDLTGALTRTDYDEEGRVVTEYRHATLVGGGFPTALALSVSDVSSNAPAPVSADRSTHYAYDNDGRLRFIEDAEGYVTQYLYDDAGNIVRTNAYSTQYPGASAKDYATYQTWDDPGLARISDAVFDAANRQVYSIDPTGAVTAYDYDGAGNIIEQTRFATLRTIGSYPSEATMDGWAAANAGSGDRVTGYSYDDAGRLASETVDPAGLDLQTRYAYDDAGRVSRVTDPAGIHTDYAYDTPGRLISEIVDVGGLALTTTHAYDDAGNRITTTDPNGNDNFFFYDAVGRLTHEIDGEKYVTETRYTATGEVKDVIRHAEKFAGTVNPNVPPAMVFDGLVDAKTSFGYDDLGRLTSVTDAEGGIESYVLDAFGDRVQITNKLGGVTTNIFDARGLLVRETLPITSQGEDVVNRYYYDAYGNMTRSIEALLQDAAGEEQRITDFTYDANDRLLTKSGEARSVVAANGTIITGFVPVESFAYDAQGNLTELVAADGAKTLFYYDDANRRTHQVDAVGTVTQWTFDANGNAITQRIHATQIAHGAALPANNANDRITSFTYDAADRMLTETVDDLSWGYYSGNGDYVFQTGAATQSYVYDANGNVIRETNAMGGQTHHYYDAANRRIATVDPLDYLTEYTHDAEGNVTREWRFSAVATGVSTTGYTAPAGNSQTDRITNFTYDLNGNRKTATRRYVDHMTINGGTGALTQVDNADSTITYAYNALGQITKKTEANGDVTDYFYDSIGRLLSTTGAEFKEFLNGTDIRQRSVNVYDGLNNLVSTTVGRAGSVNGTVLVTSSHNRETLYSYGAGGLLTSMTDASGFVRTFAYDKAGRVVRESYTRSRADGTSVNERVAYGYDALGRVTSQAVETQSGGTWSSGETRETAYTAFGDIASRGINGGAQEFFEYDNAGRLWRSNQGDGVAKIYVRDRNDRVTLVAQSNGTFDVSSNANYASVGAFLSAITDSGHADYDSATKLVDDDRLSLTSTQYDARGQVVGERALFREIDDGSGGITRATLFDRYDYDAHGNLIAHTDARGTNYETEYFYDTRGQLIKTVTPTVGVTGEDGVTTNQRLSEYRYYDIAGRLIGTQDYAGTRTTQTLIAGTGHDGTQAKVATTFNPDGGQPVNSYDVFHELRYETDALGRTTYHIHDKMGRVIESRSAAIQDTVSSSDGLISYFAYDGLGQVTQRWNNQLGATHKELTEYDAQGRVISVIDYEDRETTYSYAWSGSVTTTGLDDYNGWIKTTVKNADLASIYRQTMTEEIGYFGRISAGKYYGGYDFRVTFDKAGRETLMEKDTSWGDYTQDTATAYFNSGLVSKITDTNSRTGSDLRLFISDFRYDAVGNRVFEKYRAPYTENDYDPVLGLIQVTSTVTYQEADAGYDALNRLVSVDDAGGAGWQDGRDHVYLDFTYDANGNRRSVSYDYGANGGATGSHWYLYDSMNRVTLSRGWLDAGSIVRKEPGAGT